MVAIISLLFLIPQTSVSDAPACLMYLVLLYTLQILTQIHLLREVFADTPDYLVALCPFPSQLASQIVIIHICVGFSK